MRARHQRLCINVDHVATLRQARGGIEPDPIEAAAVCESAGADGITAHLREDRRHMQDADIRGSRNEGRHFFNFETACVDEMIAIALEVRPSEVTFVPERREEVTTEGGLDVLGNVTRIERAVTRLRDAGIRVSLFIDPDLETVRASKDVGAHAVELHTGRYSHDSPGEPHLRRSSAAQVSAPSSASRYTPGMASLCRMSARWRQFRRLKS